MVTFRFYAITKGGDRTVGRDIECEDAAAAQRLAADLLPGYATIEVWQGLEFVYLAAPVATGDPGSFPSMLPESPPINELLQ